MLGHSPRQKAAADPAILVPWLKETVLRPEDATLAEVRVRLRGNILHVLWESAARGALPRELVLMRLVRSLQAPEVKARLEDEFPQIYQIYVYSRGPLDSKPAWSAPIYLNRLDKHLALLVHGASDAETVAKIAAAASLASEDSVLANNVQGLSARADESATDESVTDESVTDESGFGAPLLKEPEESKNEEIRSNVESLAASPPLEQLLDISLARRGDSSAIARYLSEALSALNVGVKVSARVVPGKARRAKAVVAVPLINAANQNASSQNASHPSASATNSAINQSVAEPAISHSAALDQNAAAVVAESDDSASSDLVSRLWVFCEASYSPDPLLIAEPIAERLRQLHLGQFQDAVITIQVTGEAASDWRLRVDLTPPEKMLREWGRWGDVPALSRLVNQISRRYGLKLVTEFKKSSLHLISYAVKDVLSPTPIAENAPLPSPTVDIDGLVGDVSSLLRAIAPQGVQRAMLYGPSTDDISPEWLRGIELPAAEDPELAKSAMSLASEGNMPALAYCLTRALNPDIKDQLATGGIRVQLLQKDRLLHVMADGPICPPKNAIVPLITQTLEQANVSSLVEGVRLYGRRAGQKQPIWTQGQDYQRRERMVPEAKPEFAASEAYIGELITAVTDASLSAEVAAGEAESDLGLMKGLARAFQYALIKSQVFVPADETSGLRSKLPRSFQTNGGKMALIWGAVGLLLAVQVDFIAGQALRQTATSAVSTTAEGLDAEMPKTGQGDSEGVEQLKPNGFNDELAGLDWNEGQTNGDQSQSALADDGFLADGSTDVLASASGDRRFDNRDFTASAINDSELIYSPQQDFISTSSLLAGSTLPTFRSQQLDEKLALYRRRIAQSGPPDVLVIGSSRALRGVDPAALRQSLGAAGYEGLSIFNFGVNGATAQVVDLIVRRLIPPDQLPQIIVWADGARAFNSGRTDVTFDAIATSEGYQQLESGVASDGMNDLALGSLSEQLTARARSADQRLSELLGKVSSGYTHRSRVRTALGQGFGAISKPFQGRIAPGFLAEEGITETKDTPTGAPTETSLIDSDGFLALSNRFNPATYYNDHARVAGAYDGDYQAFRLEGIQEQALTNLLTYTTEKNVPVIFVNTPLTDEYLDAHRMKAEDFFVQYMAEVAQSSPTMTFRDMGQLWPQRYDYFSDPSHLNRYGAYQVATRLAQDPLISWPQSLPAQSDEPQ